MFIISQVAGGLGLEENLLVLAARAKHLRFHSLLPSWAEKSERLAERLGKRFGRNSQFQRHNRYQTDDRKPCTDNVNEAYGQMINNKARFRIVLKMNNPS